MTNSVSFRVFALRILLYEYLTATGGGLIDADRATVESMLREGTAMLAALAEDLSMVPDIEVFVLRSDLVGQFDIPCSQLILTNPLDERNQFQQVAIECDAAIVIAPE